jgi:hypothetical protein
VNLLRQSRRKNKLKNNIAYTLFVLIVIIGFSISERSVIKKQLNTIRVEMHETLVFYGLWTRSSVSFSEYFMSAPLKNFYRYAEIFTKSMFNFKSNVDKVSIDMKFKKLTKIRIKRDEALKLGRLVQSDDDYVGINLTIGNNNINAKARLKGDGSDHWKSDTWSYKVKLRGKDSFYGMRVFAIQHPSTRNNFATPVFYKVMRKFGVIAPRYEFINLAFNGDNKGLMAVEENFSKELIEYNKRKEGILFHLDEEDLWSNKEVFTYRDFRKAEPKIFRYKQVKKNNLLVKNSELAISLFRGFVNGDLLPSEVFDAVTMGKFLAISDSFGSEHNLNWNNIRFYFNPMTLKIEPVAYDPGFLSAYYSGRNPGNSLIYDLLINGGENKSTSELSNLDMIHSILLDKEIFSEYLYSLKKFSEMPINSIEEIVEYIDSVKDKFRLRPLRETSFNFVISNSANILEGWEDLILNTKCDNTLECFDYTDNFQKTLQFPYKSLNTYSDAQKMSRKEDEYKSYVRIYYSNENGGGIELSNKVPVEISIKSLCLKLNMNNCIKWTGDLDKATYGKDKTYSVEATTSFLQGLNVDNDIVVNMSILGRNTKEIVKAANIPHARALSPISELKNKSNDDLILYDGNKMYINAGEKYISKGIYVPYGYHLIINAGAKLKFNQNAFILSEGQVSILGDEKNKVYLSGVGNSEWEGITIINKGQTITFNNVEISNAKNLEGSGTTYSGGINIVGSNLIMKNVDLFGSKAEDFLNIVSSNFDIDGLYIAFANKDALDIDFSNGNLRNIVIHDVGYGGGGDALDFSGSNTSVTNAVIYNVADKAVSIGEKSYLIAHNVDITGVNIGVASKDNSKALLSDFNITSYGIAGISAYNKKAEYGGGEIIFNNGIIDGENDSLSQVGSSIVIDGTQVNTVDFDSSVLY